MLFELAYETRAVPPAECPDRGAFVLAVQNRTSKAVEGQGPGGFRLRVTIEADSSGAKGVLDIREGDGPAEQRSVAGRTCKEVADGLALVTAIFLDPDGKQSPEEPPLPPSKAETKPGPAKPEPVPPPPPPRAAEERPARWHFLGGGEIGATGGIGPGASPMFGLSATFALHTTSLFAPSFRAGFDLGGTSEDLARGSQSYLWVAGSIRACPVYLASASAPIRIGPCAGFQLGWHRGATNGVVDASTSSDLWLAPTVGASFEWAISSGLTLELTGSALFPVRRTRFFLAPSTTLYDVPAAAGFVTIGALVRFL